MATGKKYGLIIPNSKKTILARKNVVSSRPSVFSNDSSSDEDAHKEVNVQIHQEALKKKVQKQTKIEIQKALEQDSTVYEYDSIYDDMKDKSKKKIPAGMAKADKQRKPKYIASLMKAAEKRASERERIEERKIQREREKEGGEFDDKEEFVTSAYRQKMLERQKEMEEEKRMDAIEEALDVRKQKDLTGFYRNFLNRELCEEPNKDDAVGQKEKNISDEVVVTANDEDRDTDMSFSSDEEQADVVEVDSDHQDSKPISHQSDRRSREKSRERSEKRCESRSRRDDSRDSSSRDTRGTRRERCRDDSRGTLRERSRDDSRGAHRERSLDNSDRTHRKRSRDRSVDRRDRSGTDDRPRRRDSSDRYDSKRNKKDKDRRRRSVSLDSSHDNDANTATDSLDKKVEIDANVVPTEGDKDDSGKVVVGPSEEAKPASSFAKRTDGDKALSARERYLARKAAQSAKPVVEDSD